jgi:anhydro-N-acetylmuramic acid kinase
VADVRTGGRYVGLLSGTSADGIDAVLLEVQEIRGSRWPDVQVEAFRCHPFPDDARERILAAASGRAGSPDLTRLRRDLGEWFGEAVGVLLEGAGVDASTVEAVGCHGQTVWHQPPEDGAPGSSLQLVDPSVLAAMAGIPVVHDFRSADLAAGGEGAPLVPWPDRILFSRPEESVALQNLGGMGNVTWLPPREVEDPPLAFDTGPANALLDVCAGLASGGRLRFDPDGAMARAGTVDDALLDRLLGDPFFQREPPRSTGRERFGPELVRRLVQERGLMPGRPGAATEPGWNDLAATFAALTVESVARALERWVLPLGVDRVILTGGGARNPVLEEGLRARLDPLPVETGRPALGMDPDAREAAAFALLAWAFLRGVAGNVPRCTGAGRPAILGSWTPAPTRSRPWPFAHGRPASGSEGHAFPTSAGARVPGAP